LPGISLPAGIRELHQQPLAAPQGTSPNPAGSLVDTAPSGGTEPAGTLGDVFSSHVEFPKTDASGEFFSPE